MKLRKSTALLSLLLATMLLGCSESEEELEARLERERLYQLGKKFDGISLDQWIQTLEKETFWVQRANAAKMLGTIGEDARVAVPALIAALKDENGRVREKAAEALAKLGPIASGADGPLQEALAAETDKKTRAALEQSIAARSGLAQKTAANQE